MKRLMEIYRPLLALLLLLQSSIVYALPAGVHLNLCIGTDGDFDVLSEYCSDSSLLHQSQPSSTIIVSEDHHGECLDIVINHVAQNELFSPTLTVGSAKTKITGKSLSQVVEDRFVPWHVVQSSIPPSCLAGGISPSSHLACLQTVVLLI